MRTVPVKYSAGPLAEGSEPILLISISSFGCGVEGAPAWARRIAGNAKTAPLVFKKVRRETGLIEVVDLPGDARLHGEALSISRRSMEYVRLQPLD